MVGGAIGSLFRFLLSGAIIRVIPGPFPSGTFAINVSGSFLIGFLTAAFLHRPELPTNLRLFLITGFLGGYTTFSSFELEALIALRSGSNTVAASYVLLSVGLGLLVAWIGLMLGMKVWPES
jgi:fluoride exporter